MSLHEKDKPELEAVQNSLGVGKISQQGSESLQFCVTSFEELDAVINHFDQYPLLTNKRADYDL